MRMRETGGTTKGDKLNRTVLTVLVIAGIGMGIAHASLFGLGPMIGAPTGLSAKLYTSYGMGHADLDAGLGYNWYRDTSYEAYGDLQFHTASLTSRVEAEGAVTLYTGVGAQVRLSGQSKNPTVRAALRMPFGIEYISTKVPIGLFMEAVPIFNLGTTDNYFGGSAVVGFRYYWAL